MSSLAPPPKDFFFFLSCTLAVLFFLLFPLLSSLLFSFFSLYCLTAITLTLTLTPIPFSSSLFAFLLFLPVFTRSDLSSSPSNTHLFTQPTNRPNSLFRPPFPPSFSLTHSLTHLHSLSALTTTHCSATTNTTPHPSIGKHHLYYYPYLHSLPPTHTLLALPPVCFLTNTQQLPTYTHNTHSTSPMLPSDYLSLGVEYTREQHAVPLSVIIKMWSARICISPFSLCSFRTLSCPNNTAQQLNTTTQRNLFSICSCLHSSCGYFSAHIINK